MQHILLPASLKAFSSLAVMELIRNIKPVLGTSWAFADPAQK